MRIEFSKMQGLGNDFLVFDAPPASVTIDAARIRSLADRRLGVGFDQALVLEPARDPQSCIAYRVFNADGSEVEQCGNGARCVAALMFTRRPGLGQELRMDSAAGVIRARACDDGRIAVDMGIPVFAPSALPMEAPAEAESYLIEIDGATLEFGAVSMGNPHIVLEVPDISTAPVGRLGAALETHRRFAKRTNVGFMQVIGRDRIGLRVHERGVGETLACGTGACAAVAVGRRRGLLDAHVRVDLPGGALSVDWAGPGERVWLTGPATSVYAGVIDL